MKILQEALVGEVVEVQMVKTRGLCPSVVACLLLLSFFGTRIESKDGIIRSGNVSICRVFGQTVTCDDGDGEVKILV